LAGWVLIGPYQSEECSTQHHIIHMEFLSGNDVAVLVEKFLVDTCRGTASVLIAPIGTKTEANLTY
jgi:hypothetical protein